MWWWRASGSPEHPERQPSRSTAQLSAILRPRLTTSQRSSIGDGAAAADIGDGAVEAAIGDGAVEAAIGDGAAADGEGGELAKLTTT